MLRLSAPKRTIAIASDFRVNGAKSPDFLQKEGVLGSEIAARNRKSLATFHRTLKSQCSICFLLSGKSLQFLWYAMGIAIANRKNRCDFSLLSVEVNSMPHMGYVPVTALVGRLSLQFVPQSKCCRARLQLLAVDHHKQGVVLCSLSLSLSLSLALSLSLYPYLYLFFLSRSLSLSLSLAISISLSFSLSFSLFHYSLSLSLSIYLSFFLYFSRSLSLSLYISISLFFLSSFLSLFLSLSYVYIYIYIYISLSHVICCRTSRQLVSKQ